MDFAYHLTDIDYSKFYLDYVSSIIENSDRWYKQIQQNINKPITYNIMVLDIETAGPPIQTIIQIAYNIYDKNMTLLNTKNFILNDGSGQQDFYQKISLHDIIYKGIHPSIVMQELSDDIKICKYLVGHNIIGFDTKHILRYSELYQIPISIPNQLDTMRLSKDIVKAKNIKGHIKNPRLGELYYHIFKTHVDANDAHTANYDVDVTAKCFKYLVDTMVVSLC